MLSQVAVVILVEHARLRRERSHGLNISQRTSFCVFFLSRKLLRYTVFLERAGHLVKLQTQ